MSNSIRILLTGDNHIGRRYAGHERGPELAEGRISAFRDIVRTANDEGCSLFIISGDLFDSTVFFNRGDVQSVVQILSGFHGTVFVLPGNHDYYDSDVKIWKCFSEFSEKYNNIVLMNQYRPYRITVNDRSVVLLPAFCMTLHSRPGKNNLDKIRTMLEDEHDVEAVRIGIAHGAIEGVTDDKEGLYFLMNRKELDSLDVDCMLIGHTHVPYPRNIADGFSNCGTVFNAGSHVQTDVSNNTEGLCFIIDINEQKEVTAKKFVSGNIRFYRRTVNVTGGGLASDIENALSDIPDHSVVDLIVFGSADSAEYSDRYGIIEKALSRFFEKSYDCSDLVRRITKEIIDAEYPETSLPARLLTALLDEQEEAQLVYDLLKSLKGGNA